MTDSSNKISPREILTFMTNDDVWKCGTNPELCLTGVSPVPETKRVAPAAAQGKPATRPVADEVQPPADRASAKHPPTEAPTAGARASDRRPELEKTFVQPLPSPFEKVKPPKPEPWDSEPRRLESGKINKHWTDKVKLHAERAAKGGISTLLLGDSIMEAAHVGGMKGALGKDAVNFGIKGDSTQHLKWRLQHGEADIPVGKQPENAVLLIGANNVINGDDPHDTARGIVADLDEAQKRMPNTKFLVVGVLPQGDANDPRRAEISTVNADVRAALQNRPNTRFKDIGPQMLLPNGDQDPRYFQADGVHPTYTTNKQNPVSGYGKMFQLIKPELDQM